MRLAYSISGYKKPSQFRWLFDAVHDRRDLFAIHIDAKAPAEVYRGFVRIAGGWEGVSFIEREPVVWMGIGLVRAELRAIRQLLERSPPFDYLISLSAQDYPLVDRDTLVSALEQQPQRNWISCEPLRDLPFHIRRRPHLWAFERRGRLIKTPIPRPVPSSLTIAWKGSWWRVLSRNFCEWLVQSERSEAYLRFLAHVQAPDELFFQNLIMSSPFRETLAERNRHHVLWDGKSGSPQTLTMAHWHELIRSPCWFARKFDQDVDRMVLERLARRIGARVPDEIGQVAAVHPQDRAERAA